MLASSAADTTRPCRVLGDDGTVRPLRRKAPLVNSGFILDRGLFRYQSCQLAACIPLRRNGDFPVRIRAEIPVIAGAHAARPGAESSGVCITPSGASGVISFRLSNFASIRLMRTVYRTLDDLKSKGFVKRELVIAPFYQR